MMKLDPSLCTLTCSSFSSLSSFAYVASSWGNLNKNRSKHTYLPRVSWLSCMFTVLIVLHKSFLLLEASWLILTPLRIRLLYPPCPTSITECNVSTDFELIWQKRELTGENLSIQRESSTVLILLVNAFVCWDFSRYKTWLFLKHILHWVCICIAVAKSP